MLLPAAMALALFVAVPLSADAADAPDLVVLAYALWPSRKAQFDEAARMPLRED